jgi:protein O-GlcNAc transferase
MTEAEALFGEAAGFHASGRLAEAEQALRRILAVTPTHADSLALLGIIAFQTGHPDAALELLGEAIHHDGLASSHHTNLGNILKSLGRRDEAEASYRRALALHPACAQTLCNLGMVLHELDRTAEAEDCLRRSLALAPDHADSHYNLALILRHLGRPDEAAAAFRRAIALHSDHLGAHFHLGDLLSGMGHAEEASDHFRQAIGLRPDFAEAHNALGGVLGDLGRFEEAAASHRTALELCPDFIEAHYNLGRALSELGRLDEAEACFRQAIALDAGFALAHNSLGAALAAQGRAAEALEHFRKALALEPANVLVHRNLLSAVLYQPGWSEERRFGEHRAFEARHAAPLYPQAIRFANPPDPERRLRIGYLSADLKNHPVGRNLIPLVERHDAGRVELFFYSHLSDPDETTARFQARAAGWRPIAGLDDRAAAEAIRADGIDILVSLAGRFDLNRPQICAFRPAPVQVSFHDPATSGLGVMDYLIADPVLVPRHGGERFTERVIRLPSFYLHDPIAEAPPVTPPPMLGNGYPTLGSFNNPAKLSDDTLALWAAVMRRLPHARLRLKYRQWFAAPAVVDRITAVMTRNGIDPGRIDLLGSGDDTRAHLAQYDAIDMALDPFPFTGSTTTFEALWMGVPVVTLAGETMVSRWSASILTPLGLTDLIAPSPEAYVEICARLCSDPERLVALRAGLRRRVAVSPLCDAQGRARQMERIYRALWRRWCATTA